MNPSSIVAPTTTDPFFAGSGTLRVPKIYIIILNWNGWRDTIECLESVFRLNYANYTVIVCDNDSSDGSMEQLRRWAVGDVVAGCANPALLALTLPHVPKPIPYRYYESPSEVETIPCTEKLLLIETGGNLGFAGGNNVGLRYALGCGDLDYAWLLNNDTVVRPDALGYMVNRIHERPNAGVCGSTLLYYFDPSKVQALGGATYNRWLARGEDIGRLECVDSLPQPEEVEEKMKYVVGASVLVSNAFLETIGPLNEEYFLYFEEIDWATKAKGKYQLAYCPESIVYHKESASIGANSLERKQSTLSVYNFTKGRVAFTRRYYPYALVVVCGNILLRAILHTKPTVDAIIRGLLSGLCSRNPKRNWR
jgi:hypothetical protein